MDNFLTHCTFTLKANVTFCTYWKTLKSNFSDINEKYNARLHLEVFKQGSLEITDFFSEFEMLADMAGHPLRDLPPVEDKPQSTFVFEIIQAMLERSINTKLINWMMATPQYPLMSSYEEIKTLANYGDAMFKKQCLHKATQGTSTLPTTTTNNHHHDYRQNHPESQGLHRTSGISRDSNGHFPNTSTGLVLQLSQERSRCFKDGTQQEEGIHLPGPMQVLQKEAIGEWPRRTTVSQEHHSKARIGLSAIHRGRV